MLQRIINLDATSQSDTCLSSIFLSTERVRDQGMLTRSFRLIRQRYQSPLVMNEAERFTLRFLLRLKRDKSYSNSQRIKSPNYDVCVAHISAGVSFFFAFRCLTFVSPLLLL